MPQAGDPQDGRTSAGGPTLASHGPGHCNRRHPDRRSVRRTVEELRLLGFKRFYAQLIDMTDIGYLDEMAEAFAGYLTPPAGTSPAR